MTEQKQAGRPAFFGKKMHQYKISLPTYLKEVAQHFGGDKGVIAEGVRDRLESARHVFETDHDNDRFCKKCGCYVTHGIHIRVGEQ
jgi:hypothetical protein